MVKETGLPSATWSGVEPLLPAGASTLAPASESFRGPEILSTPICRGLGAILLLDITMFKKEVKKKCEVERLEKRLKRMKRMEVS